MVNASHKRSRKPRKICSCFCTMASFHKIIRVQGWGRVGNILEKKKSKFLKISSRKIKENSMISEINRWIQILTSFFDQFPPGIYLFKVNIGNTKTTCEIRSKLTIKTPYVVLLSLLLTLNRFHAMSWCFYC